MAERAVSAPVRRAPYRRTRTDNSRMLAPDRGIRPSGPWPAAAAGVLALIGLGVAPPPAAASFKVFPTLIDVKRDPGRAAVGSFNVALEGEGGRRFIVTVKDAVEQPNGTFAYQRPGTSPFSASNWVSVTPRGFAGGPNRTQPIEYRIAVPANAEPGDHATSVIVSRLPGSSQATAQPVEAVAVRLDVLVSGPVKTAAKITSLEAPSITGTSPVTVTASVENTGNVRLDFDHRNKGSLAILSGSDQKAATEFSGFLYPGQSRTFELSWDNPPLFGHFAATASVDEGRHVASESKSIWFVPWRQLGALILVALAALVITLGVHRRRLNG